jgi:hypothetical protein
MLISGMACRGVSPEGGKQCLTLLLRRICTYCHILAKFYVAAYVRPDKMQSSIPPIPTQLLSSLARKERHGEDHHQDH